MISLGTQTDLNFELILNFISNDLPRLVSYDLVPLLLKIMTDPCKDSSGDLNKSLRRKVEELIRDIVEKSLPKSQTLEINREVTRPGREVTRPGYAPVPKRRKTNTVAAQQNSSVTLIHKPECPVCGEAFERYPDVVQHLLSHRETVFRAINCNLCNFFTFEPRALAGHMKDTHLLGKGAPISLRCKICQEAFYSESALNKHKRSFHRGSDIPKCPKCNVLFEFSSQLVTHLRFSATCGGDTKPPDPETSRYLKLPPSRAHRPSPATPAAPQAAVSGQGSTNTANMVGNALLSALTVEAGAGGADSAIVAVSQTSHILGPQNMSDNLIMDPTTGVPIPVAQFVEKRQAEIANGVEIMNTTTHTNKGYKCSVCNRSFTSLSMLVHHNEKAHLRKKTLSCTQCHLLFATFPELDSHFHRIHRKRSSPSSESPAIRPVAFTCDNKSHNKTDNRADKKADEKTDGESAEMSSAKSSKCSVDKKINLPSPDIPGVKNILHHASTCTDSENKACEDKIYKATVLELETPGKEEIKQKNKIKAKPSDNKTSETESRSEHLDPEMEKCEEFSSEKSFDYVQIKSKRGRTTAKIDYSKL